MRWIHGLRARLRLLFRRSAEERMDEEMRFHLEQETEKYLREGMSFDEARRRAALRFGGMEGHKEELRAGRTLAWVGGLSLDLKLGLRMLRRYPGLTAVGGMAMAFAIAVGSATFEVVKLALHPTLPLPEGDRIVGLNYWNRESNGQELPRADDLLVWRTQLGTVRDIGGFRSVERNLFIGSGSAEPVEVAEISAAGFRVAGTPPLLGRFLVEGDDQPGAAPVVVLGYRLWRTRFGADPAAVGRVVRIGRSEATVVGVMPEGFTFPVGHSLWAPLRLESTAGRPGDGAPVRVFGRLAPGVTLADARAEVSTLASRAAVDFPERHRHLAPQLLPYAQSIIWISPDAVLRAGIYSINGFAALLLLLVCGNVALLMFARAVTREREILLRNALGASRARIMVQLFAEALVLGLGAAVLGLGAASLGIRLVERALRTGSSDPWPFWFDSSLSGTTILYAALLTLVTAAIAGIAPAIKVTGRGMEARLREATTGGGGLRMGGIWTGMIVAQIAATVVFASVAYVVHRQAAAIGSVAPAFPAEEYLAVRLEVEGDRREAANRSSGGGQRNAAMVGELERRLEADAGVGSVTVAEQLPMMPHPSAFVRVEGSASKGSTAAGHNVRTAAVAPDFFDVFQAPVIAGRTFDSRDLAESARTVVVNQMFVDQVLGGRNAVGQRVRLPSGPAGAGGGAEGPWHEIVGVVRDLVPAIQSPMNLDNPARPQLYQPLRPERVLQGPLYLAAHVRGDPGSVVAPLRRIAGELDPELRLSDVQPLHRASSSDARAWRLVARLILVASSVALLLSLAGIYSVMSFTVSRRTREIGIRIALGAEAARVVLEIFRRPLGHVVAGVLIGSVVMAGIVAALTGSVTMHVAALLVAGAAGMMGVCALACIHPVVRALRVEPTEVLSAEP